MAPINCSTRYYYVKSKHKNEKYKMNKEDDVKLLKLIYVCGFNWDKIASFFPKISQPGLYQHWNYYLDPKLNNDEKSKIYNYNKYFIFHSINLKLINCMIF